jgi:hypothetical protein
LYLLGRKNAPYPDLDQLWEISTEGAIQVLLIYLELQTANSPQTDCSLYMNRFLLGSMSSGITEEGKIIHPHFDLKPLRHRNYLGKTAEISILFGWTTRSTFFLIAILV